MAVPRLDATRPADLAPRLAAALDAGAQSVFQRTAYARALSAVRDDAFVLQAGEGGVHGHTIVRVESAAGFTKWNGIATPVVVEPEAFWAALVEGARAARMASVTWREPTTARFAAAEIAAAARACASAGAQVRVGECHGLVVALEPGPDALWARFDRRHRTAVRHAERTGVQAALSPPAAFVDAFIPLADATWARSGRSGPTRAYFDVLLAGAPEWALLYLARDASGAAAAGALVALDDGGARAVYLHGASVPAPPGASHLLQSYILRDLHARGVGVYDMGGGAVPGTPLDSPREQGIRRFKERFGATPVRWPTLHVVPDPALYEEARAAVAASAPQR